MRLLRKFFLAGLLFWLPMIATILVVRFFVQLMDNIFAFIPVKYHPETIVGFAVPGLGMLLSLLLVICTGIILTNFLGQQIVRTWERLLARIPLVRSIYRGSKQITEALTNSRQSFRQVALIEYPRKGVWTLAFVAGDTSDEIHAKTAYDALLNVFVPTTPNPTSGYLLMVPKEDVHILQMSPEEALKMIISGGVVVPPWRQQTLSQDTGSA